MPHNDDGPTWDDVTRTAVRGSIHVTLADGSEGELPLLIRDIPTGKIDDLDRRMGRAQEQGDEAVLNFMADVFDDYLIQPDKEPDEIGLNTSLKIFAEMQQQWMDFSDIQAAQDELAGRMDDQPGN